MILGGKPTILRKHPYILSCWNWVFTSPTKNQLFNPKQKPPQKTHHPQLNGGGRRLRRRPRHLCVVRGCPSFDIRKLQFQLGHLPGTNQAAISEDGFFGKKHGRPLFLVGGWTNTIWKICLSNWFSDGFGKNVDHLVIQFVTFFWDGEFTWPFSRGFSDLQRLGMKRALWITWWPHFFLQIPTPSTGHFIWAWKCVISEFCNILQAKHRAKSWIFWCHLTTYM